MHTDKSIETVYGSVVGRKLLHDGIEETITSNQFHKDILDDYIQIRRETKKIIIIDYYRRNIDTGDV